MMALTSPGGGTTRNLPALPPSSPKLPFLSAPLPTAGILASGSQQSSTERLPEPGSAAPQELNRARQQQQRFLAAPAAAPRSEAPSAASGDGADHIAACMFENTDVSEAAAGSSLAFLALLMDRVRSQQLLGRKRRTQQLCGVIETARDGASRGTGRLHPGLDFGRDALPAQHPTAPFLGAILCLAQNPPAPFLGEIL